MCYGSGFGELGAVDLQSELLEAAGDVPFLGPNCYGFVNTFDRVALWPDEHGMHPVGQGVAIVSQSGNVAVNLTFQERGLRLGTIISVGNQASIGMEDCIDAFLDDPRITAIGLFLEAVRDPQHFARVAQRAHAQGVPIVALAHRPVRRRCSDRHVAHRLDVGTRRGVRRAVRPLRRGHRDNTRRDVGDPETARQRRATERPATSSR